MRFKKCPIYVVTHTQHIPRYGIWRYYIEVMGKFFGIEKFWWNINTKNAANELKNLVRRIK